MQLPTTVESALAPARYLHLALLICTLGAVAAGCHEGGRKDNPSALLRSLLAEKRLVEGRLSLEAPYAPCALGASELAVDCPSLAALGPEWLDELRDARRGLEQTRDPETWSLMRLVTASTAGDLDPVIATLELLSREPGAKRPGRLSDLAAAYLHRAQLDGDVRDVLLGLERADEALAVSPALPTAAFNRAIALERLRLVRQAAEAWHRYRQLDPLGGWADEAARRTARLAALDPGPADRDGGVSRLARQLAPGAHETAPAVDRHPESAAEAGLRIVLADWARLSVSGERPAAAERLDQLVELGQALERRTGDPFLADVAAQFRREPSRSMDLARHCLELETAIADYEGWQLARAARTLDRLEPELRALNSPLALVALRYRATCSYQARQPAEAGARAERLLHLAEQKGYADLAGKAAWIRGLVAFEARDVDSAQRYLDAAVRHFQDTGARRQQGAVQALLSTVSSYIGDSDLAWRQYREAIEAMVLGGIDRRYPVRVGAAAREASALGLHRAARELAEEAYSFDAQSGDPVAITESHWQRARILREGGWEADAARELSAAFDETAQIRSDSVRGHTRAGLLTERGLLLARTRPAAALAAFDEAEAVYSDEQFSLSRGELATARANVLLSTGHRGAAAVLLEQLIAELTSEARQVREVVERVRLFDQMAPSFETLVSLRIEDGLPPEATLTLAEEGRSLELAQRTGAPPAREAVDEAVGRRALGPVVELLPLPTRIAWWVAADGALAQGSLPVTAERFRDLLSSVRQALESGDRALFRRESGRLYEVLLAPLHLPPGGTLTIVPAGPLLDVPWAALVDPRTGRYLTEQYALVFAPSTRVLVQTRRAAAWSASLLSSGALVVGDPAFDGQRFPSLARLPGARDEARAVARLLPGSLLQEGSAATPSAFTDALGSYPLVHFSGHARDLQNPLFSELVFAPEAAGRGSTLRAETIYGLDLRRTQLVVLAACSTATGYRSKLEGSLGLAQAFLAAGVPRVIATRWPVADGTGAALFTVFYRELQLGREPSLALRNAQRASIRATDPRISDPRAWAAYQLLGAAGVDETGKGKGQ